MNSKLPAGATLCAWYCPALGMYHRPGPAPDVETPQWLRHTQLLNRFEWLPLYAFAGAVPEGWVLRSYFSPADDAFYASHRTMSEKTATHPGLEGLYAPPGTAGNDSAGHVPPNR